MRLSDLQPAPGSHKTERRLGRGHGSGRGKTAGRGTKGQKARTGGKIHRAFNGGQTRLSKRLPFVRGLGNSNTAFRDNYAVVNIAELEAFEANSQVTPETLAAQGLITRNESKGLLKILGNGDVDRVLTIRAHKISAGARAKIEAAGGTIELIPVKVYEKTKRRKDEKPAATVAATVQDADA
ncbi:MAG TPA: 50S ribosomal protein L15 [Ktedonobacteraceae bacterium]|nr:50S ribosomal protein L15 [Ktedonobacteraceae bacterium]